MWFSFFLMAAFTISYFFFFFPHASCLANQFSGMNWCIIKSWDKSWFLIFQLIHCLIKSLLNLWLEIFSDESFQFQLLCLISEIAHRHLMELQLAVSETPRRLLRRGSCAFSQIYRSYVDTLPQAKVSGMLCQGLRNGHLSHVKFASLSYKEWVSFQTIFQRWKCIPNQDYQLQVVEVMKLLILAGISNSSITPTSHAAPDGRWTVSWYWPCQGCGSLPPRGAA